MQWGKRRVFPDLDAPPDRRMNAAQRRFELVQGTILFYRHDYSSPVTKMPRTEKVSLAPKQILGKGCQVVEAARQSIALSLSLSQGTAFFPSKTRLTVHKKED